MSRSAAKVVFLFVLREETATRIQPRCKICAKQTQATQICASGFQNACQCVCPDCGMKLLLHRSTGKFTP